jgi:hypothetical protein
MARRLVFPRAFSMFRANFARRLRPTSSGARLSSSSRSSRAYQTSSSGIAANVRIASR